MRPEVNQLKDDKLDKPAAPPVAAGKVLMVLAVNEDGTFTCEWADAPSGGVTDVKVLGKSVVSDGVANILFGSSNNPGVLKIAALPQIIDRNPYCAVVASTLDTAVKYAMCDGKGAAWTAEEQAAARERIGIHKVTQSEYDALTDTSGIYIIVEE